MAHPDGPIVVDKDYLQTKLLGKQAAIMDVQRILLQQLAELPGAVCKTDDGRDLSRILNQVTNDADHMGRWIQLVQEL